MLAEAAGGSSRGGAAVAVPKARQEAVRIGEQRAPGLERDQLVPLRDGALGRTDGRGAGRRA